MAMVVGAPSQAPPREYSPMEPAEMPGVPADAAVLPLSAVVVGCETELGRLVVAELARLPIFREVYAFSEVVVGLRGELGLEGEAAEKVVEVLIDYDRMEDGLGGVLERAVRVVAFCCLGMTKDEASSPRDYYRHNADLPVRFVAAVLEGDIMRVSVLSCKEARIPSEAQKVRGGMEEAISQLWSDAYYVQLFISKGLQPGFAFFQAPLVVVDGLRAAGDYRRQTGETGPISRRALAKQRAALRFGLGPGHALPVRDLAKAMVHEARDFVLLLETSDDPVLLANVRQLHRYAVEGEEIAALAEKAREEETKNLALSHRQRMLRRIEARDAVSYGWGEAANFDRGIVRREGELDYARPLPMPSPPPSFGPLPPSQVAGRHMLLPLGAGPEGPAAYRVVEDGGGNGISGQAQRLGEGTPRGRDDRMGGGTARWGRQILPGMRGAATEAPYMGWHGERGAMVPHAFHSPGVGMGVHGPVGADPGMGMEMLPGHAGLSARGSRSAMLHRGWREPGRQERGGVDLRGRRRPRRVQRPHDEGVQPQQGLRPVRADHGPQRYFEERLDGVSSDRGHGRYHGGYDAGVVDRPRNEGLGTGGFSMAHGSRVKPPPLTSGEALEAAVAQHQQDVRASRRQGRRSGRKLDEHERYKRSADRERRRPLDRTASMYSISEATSTSDADARHEARRRRQSVDDGIDVEDGRFRGGMGQLRDEHDGPGRGVKHTLWGLAEKLLGPGPRIRDVNDPVVAI